MALVSSLTLTLRKSKLSSCASVRPLWAKRSMSVSVQASARSTLFGPMMLAAPAMTVFGALPASRAASAATSAGSPTRLTSAATATSSSARSLASAISCTSGSARAILHRLPRDHRTDLLVKRGDLGIVWRHRLDDGKIELLRQLDPQVRAEPRLERHASFWGESRPGGVLPHDRGERRRNMSDVGDDGSFHREDRLLRREDAVDAEHLHEPPLLCDGIVCATRHRAGMTNGAGQLVLPAPNHAGHKRLGKLGVKLVIAARLHVKRRRLAACVVGKRESELGCGVVDVDILAARDQRRCAPAGHAKIRGNGRGEIAGIREDCDRSLPERLVGTVAAESPADAY